VEEPLFFLFALGKESKGTLKAWYRLNYPSFGELFLRYLQAFDVDGFLRSGGYVRRLFFQRLRLSNALAFAQLWQFFGKGGESLQSLAFCFLKSADRCFQLLDIFLRFL